MSVSWDIGFRQKPKLDELDSFMQQRSFIIEPSGEGDRWKTFSRVYVYNEKDSAREVDLFYDENPDEDVKNLFGREQAMYVKAYGCLKTYAAPEEYSNMEEKLNIIEEKQVRTEHAYYQHLAPGRLMWYETALAIKEKFDAIVLSEQSGMEIDPERRFSS